MSLFLPNLDQRPDVRPQTPRALHVDHPTVDRFAADIAHRVGYTVGASLVPILTTLGIARRSSPIGFGGTDSVLLEALGPHAQILLDPDTGPLHDRFQIARALGHWTLHYLVPNQRDGADIRWLRVDRYAVEEAALREANRFAFAFLLPEDAVRAAAQRWSNDVLGVAGHFQVAPRIANLRMKGLGLVREGTNPEAPGATQAAVPTESPATHHPTVAEAFAGLPTLPADAVRPRA